MKQKLSNGEGNPWRFLESLDADNPGDVELLKLTRANELEVVRNLILSSKVTLLYAFSGNGKSSLINAGIIPAFHRSGFAVFRTRPRPARSVGNPSQALKDCLLSEFVLPQRKGDEVLVAKARTYLAELPAHVREALEPILARAGTLVKDETERAQQDREFLKHFGDHAALALPELVEEIQRWLGSEVPLLIVLDQFEELFVHYYNTPEIGQFIRDLGQIYASKLVRAKFLFSMREDWVGSMVQFRHAIPDVFASCFKLEPLRVSQALPALTGPPKRLGVSFEEDLPNRILTDLSLFYSVLQKKSFAAVHLTPSGEKDPYIELPALQVLMEQLWKSCDLSSAMIRADAYCNLAPSEVRNPAEHVLQTYLARYLERLSASDSESDRSILADLRVDLLYLLTDRSAHRRALSQFSLLSEVNQIRAAGVLTGTNRAVDARDVERAIKPLVETKLVRDVEGFGGSRQYELTHDFLVRSVVELWNRLDRSRADEMVRFAEREQQGKERLAVLSSLASRVTNLMVGLSAISFLSVAFVPVYWLLSGDFSADDLHFLYLTGPVVLLLMAAYFRSKEAGLLALVGVVGLLGLSVRDFWGREWTGYLAHLVVVSFLMLPGVVVWVDRVRERRLEEMEWPKVAAVSLNYAYILALMMAFFWFDQALRLRAEPTFLFFVLGFWALSQGAAIVLKQASIGYIAYGLVRRSVDGHKYRAWSREAIGQALCLGLAIIAWTEVFNFGFSHLGNRIFIFGHLLGLAAFSVVTFRLKQDQGFLDRLLGTKLTWRRKGDVEKAPFDDKKHTPKQRLHIAKSSDEKPAPKAMAS